MKMYRTWYNDLIETVEVVRVTENSVYLPADSRFYKNGERRQQRHNSNHESFFDTWNEAHDFLVARTQKEIDFHENAARAIKTRLDKILEMKKDEANR